MSTLKQKTAKGLLWGGLSNGMQQLLGALIGIILLKILTPGDYAMIGLLAIFTGIANTIQESGFTAALTNRKEFKHDDYNSVFWFNLTVGSIIYIILFFGAPLIARFYNQPDLTNLSRLLFLSIIASSLGIAQGAVLFRNMMVKERAKIDITSTIIGGLVGIIMAVEGYGYWALAYQTLVYAIVGTLLRWLYSPWKPSFSFTITPIKEMFGFSFKMLLASIVTQIQTNSFSVLIGKFYVLNDVGYFTQGTKWSGMGSQLITGMVSGVAQPMLVQVTGDKMKIKQIFRKMLRFISFISFPALMGLAFVSREFIELINPEFLPCVPILQLYCIWGALAPIHLLYTQVAISYHKSGFYFNATIIFSILQIGCAVLALPFGIYWIAAINILVAFIFLIGWQIYVRKLIAISFVEVFKDISPYIFSTLLVFVVAYLVIEILKITNPILILCIKIAIPVILYILIMWKGNSVIFKEAVSYFTKKAKL